MGRGAHNNNGLVLERASQVFTWYSILSNHGSDNFSNTINSMQNLNQHQFHPKCSFFSFGGFDVEPPNLILSAL